MRLTITAQSIEDVDFVLLFDVLKVMLEREEKWFDDIYVNGMGIKLER